MGGVRTVISRQHDVILRSVYPHADSGLRNALSEQLVALLDSLLGGYVAQLNSLRRPGRQDRYDALEMEYTQRRSELLSPLREFSGYRATFTCKARLRDERAPDDYLSLTLEQNFTAVEISL